MNARTVNERIHVARLSLGLTRPEFARLTGIGIRTFDYWDAGEREPGMKSIRKIARATGRPVAWFFAFDEERVA